MADSIERIADDLRMLACEMNKSAITLGEIGLRGQCIEGRNVIGNIATRLRALSSVGDDDPNVLVAELRQEVARLRALSPAGGDWVMVPREPTLEMIDAAMLGHDDVEDTWAAMLAATPQQRPGAACPHIVQSKEGTAYCRLAESAGASGGGETPACPGCGKALPLRRGAGRTLFSTPCTDCMEWKSPHRATPASPAAPQPQDSMQVIECGGCAPPVIATPAHGDGDGATINSQSVDSKSIADPSGQTLAGAGGALMKCVCGDPKDGGGCTNKCDRGQIPPIPAETYRVTDGKLQKATATSAGATGDDSEDAADVVRDAIQHVRGQYPEDLFPDNGTTAGNGARMARLTCNNIEREFKKRMEELAETRRAREAG